MILVPIGLSLTAAAQGFDAHGPNVPPDGADVLDPVLGFGGQLPGAPAFSVLGEAASGLLVRQVVDGGVETEVPVLDALFGANLSVSAGLTRRVGLGATLPIWLGSGGESTGGLALGDLTVVAPIGLTGDGKRFAVAVVPLAGLPTGARARYLGESGLLLGGLASGSLRAGRLSFSADAGVDWVPATDTPEWPGGLHARYAVDVGGSPVDSLGLHLEARGRTPMARGVPSIPSELLLTAKIRPEERWWLTAGGGTALTRGPGASALRMLVGVSAALGQRPVEPEPLTGAPADTTELHVVDERRYPVRDALVRVGRTEARTDHEGFALLPGRTPRIGLIEVEHPNFLRGSLEVAEDEDHWQLVLIRKPVPVAINAVGPDGALEEVQISIVGPADAGEAVVDEAGVRTFQLGAGEWTVSIDAIGLGHQERTIVVDDGRTEPIRVDAVLSEVESPLTRLVVQVRDPNGAPVEDAVVSLGDRTLGTTGPGGDVVVEGLAPGQKAVTVRSAAFGDTSAIEVQLDPGDATVVAQLEWQPGSVLVRASGPDGTPTDALVALAGPVGLPSRALGSDGEEVLVLRPGTWDVLVSSPTLGTQQRRIVVDDAPGAVVVLDFALKRVEAGRADLTLHVRDLDGWPVVGAAVEIDGEAVGRTGSEGSLTLLDLDEGLRFVKITDDLLVPHNTEVDLVAGAQAHDATVSWVTGVVDVEVRSPDGGPADALLAFSGPAARPPLRAGGDGFERVVLAPGAWTVAASSERWGTQLRPVSIVEGDRRRRRLSFQLQPVEEEVGALALTVVDPRGVPVDGARVAIGGRSVGATSEGRLELRQMPLGPVDLVVRATALATAELAVDIEGATAIEVPLAWAPGAVEVTVVGPAGPEQAMLLVGGPEPVPPKVATGGKALLALGPGRWSVLASHPTLSAPEATVELSEDGALTEITLTLEPVASEAATLVLTVRDPNGWPVEGASVTVVDGPHGSTSRGGSVALRDIPAGSTQIRVAAPDLQTVVLDMTLDPGLTRHTAMLPHRPEKLTIAAPDGAEIVAFGPGSTEPAEVRDGEAELELAPGAWTIQARDGDKIATAEVLVKRGEPVARIELEPARIEATLDADRVQLSRPVQFALDSAELRPDALEILNDVARRLLADRTAAVVEVQGHTDDQGGVAYNQDLSERRAAAVVNALLTRGVARERLIARGYGLSRPVTTRKDPEGRALNRRVEFVVVRSSGR